MNKYDLCSVAGGMAVLYVNEKKPSQYLPFKGQFPIVDDVDYELYRRAIERHNKVAELTVEHQRVTELGMRMYVLERGFLEYLDNSTSYEQDEFLKLSNPEKSNIVYAWINKDCIDIKQLTFKL